LSPKKRSGGVRAIHPVTCPNVNLLLRRKTSVG
jgi:hypothetical protein